MVNRHQSCAGVPLSRDLSGNDPGTWTARPVLSQKPTAVLGRVVEAAGLRAFWLTDQVVHHQQTSTSCCTTRTWCAGPFHPAIPLLLPRCAGIRNRNQLLAGLVQAYQHLVFKVPTFSTMNDTSIPSAKVSSFFSVSGAPSPGRTTQSPSASMQGSGRTWEAMAIKPRADKLPLAPYGRLNSLLHTAAAHPLHCGGPHLRARAISWSNGFSSLSSRMPVCFYQCFQFLLLPAQAHPILLHHHNLPGPATAH